MLPSDPLYLLACEVKYTHMCKFDNALKTESWIKLRIALLDAIEDALDRGYKFAYKEKTDGL